ncbi:MAG: ribosomal protein S18-alanine N-acetyltransferase [Clostridia bacterium]|nr:ribosomal protein S18-alanine N-acetyltransferase [Clostridia bacterium]
MQTEVYVATKKDAEILAEIEASVFSDAWSPAAMDSHLDGVCSVALLLTADGVPVGSLTGSLLAPEGEIYRVAVLPAYRRRGLARALLSAFLKTARAANVEELFIEVRASNSAAQGLYRSFGFAEYGVRRNYYKAPNEDAVLMKLTLGED